MTAINTNTASMNAQYYLAKTNKEMESSMAKLSSGQKVNSAADDAAGLAIAGRMTSQIKGLNMAIKNANDTIALSQTAEGAMEEVTNMLQRMRELAVQASNGTMNDSDRASLDSEVQALKTEIDRVSGSTQFNNQNLLDGTFNKTFQIGDKAGQTVDLSIASIGTSSLGMGGIAGSSNTLVGARVNFASGAAAGDIEINGQALGAIAASSDMETVITNINNNVDNVKASGFNVVVAQNIGTGILATNAGAGASGMSISVKEQGVTAAVEFKISAANNMEELVANINAETGGVVKASINSDGKMVLSNETGAAITVDDDSTGSASGFSGTAATFNGFLKLEALDNEPIRVTKGNAGLASAGSDADLAEIGFRETKNFSLADGYSVVGAQMTTPATALAKGDLTINGTEIYDANITVDSFSKKLELINSFTSQTQVSASSFFEQTFAIDTDNLIVGETFEVNGVDITLAAQTMADLKTKLNAQVAKTGLTAETNGNNLTLSGENVQSLTIAYKSKADIDALDDATTTNSIVAGSSGAAQVTLALADVDVKIGKTYELAITDSTTVANNQTVSYKAKTGDESLDIMQGIADQLRISNAAFMDTAANTFTVADANPKATIVFVAGMNLGDANMTFGVKSSTIAAPLGAAATTFGRLKLDSVNNTPISIDLGASTSAANHAAQHGLFEANVGAADFDVNNPTMGVGSGSSMTGLSISSAASATAALKTLDNAIDSVNSIRSDLGALQNRLDHTVNNLSSVANNTEAAKGRIMDTDFATETANLTKQQILSQAATSMLAQANQSKQGILALLQG